MKNIRLFMFVLVAMSTMFVGCKKNDEKEAEKTPTDSYVAKTYQGTVVMSVGSSTYDPTNAEVILKGNGNNSVNITLPAVSGGMSQLPALTVKNVGVSTSDYKHFTLAETPIEQTVNDVHYSGKVSGSVADGNLTLNYSVKPGEMPMSINFVFTTGANQAK